MALSYYRMSDGSMLVTGQTTAFGGETGLDLYAVFTNTKTGGNVNEVGLLSTTAAYQLQLLTSVPSPFISKVADIPGQVVAAVQEMCAFRDIPTARGYHRQPMPMITDFV